MKWSFFQVGMIIFGLIGLVIIVLFVQLTVNSDEEYYLLKEVTEASMVESIDYAHFRTTGDLKIVKEKFVESFFRRFAESANLNAESYEVKIYNVVESPPKASIEIINNLGSRKFFWSTDPNVNASNINDYSVLSELDAILEYKDKKDYEPDKYWGI